MSSALKEAASTTLYELSLFGSVTEERLEPLLNGLERCCGPPSEYAVLETAMVMDRSDVRIRWPVHSNAMSLVSYKPMLRVTARPNQMQTYLAEVICRPVSIVNNGSVEHIKSLQLAGYQKRFFHFLKGFLFRWGRVQVVVAQLYNPLSTNVADYAKRLVSSDWCVRCTILSQVDAAEEAASVLLVIQKTLADRVVLSKNVAL